MARVIKRQTKTDLTAVTPSKTVPRSSGERVIEKDTYKAQIRVREILQEGNEKIKDRRLEGKKLALQAEEEAMTKGAVEAFAKASSEAIDIFKKRSARYKEAQEDIKVLALEIVTKILGNTLKLPDEQIDQIIEAGIGKLQGHRRLKLQFPSKRLQELTEQKEPAIHRVQNEPDFQLEEVTDVKEGFLRVVTDIGSMLCTEKQALAVLATKE